MLLQRRRVSYSSEDNGIWAFDELIDEFETDSSRGASDEVDRLCHSMLIEETGGMTVVPVLQEFIRSEREPIRGLDGSINRPASQH